MTDSEILIVLEIDVAQRQSIDLDGVAAGLVDAVRADGVALTGEDGLLLGLVRRVLEGGLDVEMTDHLGYAPHGVEGPNTGNSRNGYYPKTVRTDIGDVTIGVPRIATAPSNR